MESSLRASSATLATTRTVSEPTSPEGPVAVIGDVHGHVRALEQLLERIETVLPSAHLAFVGDVSHKGPDSLAAYRLVLDLIDSGRATMVASNHGAADAIRLGAALRRYRNVADAAGALYEQAHGLASHATLWHVARMAGDLAGAADGDELAERIVCHQLAAPLQARFGTDLVVVHGGLTPETFGKDNRRARQVCLYGTPTGVDERGKGVGRDSWVPRWGAARAADPSLPVVAYGHITYREPYVTGATIGVDTGCGSHDPSARLTAALWCGAAERTEFVSVPAPLA
jgi:hypothetical protein